MKFVFFYELNVWFVKTDILPMTREDFLMQIQTAMMFDGYWETCDMELSDLSEVTTMYVFDSDEYLADKLEKSYKSIVVDTVDEQVGISKLMQNICSEMCDYSTMFGVV